MQCNFLLMFSIVWGWIFPKVVWLYAWSWCNPSNKTAKEKSFDANELNFIFMFYKQKETLVDDESVDQFLWVVTSMAVNAIKMKPFNMWLKWKKKTITMRCAGEKKLKWKSSTFVSYNRKHMLCYMLNQIVSHCHHHRTVSKYKVLTTFLFYTIEQHSICRTLYTSVRNKNKNHKNICSLVNR